MINKEKGAIKGTTGNIPRIIGGTAMNQEEQRLKEARGEKIPWKKWGPLLERAPVGNCA